MRADLEKLIARAGWWCERSYLKWVGGWLLPNRHHQFRHVEWVEVTSPESPPPPTESPPPAPGPCRADRSRSRRPRWTTMWKKGESGRHSSTSPVQFHLRWSAVWMNAAHSPLMFPFLPNRHRQLRGHIQRIEVDHVVPDRERRGRRANPGDVEQLPFSLVGGLDERVRRQVQVYAVLRMQRTNLRENLAG